MPYGVRAQSVKQQSVTARVPRDSLSDHGIRASGGAKDHDNVVALSTVGVYKCVSQAQLITQAQLIADSMIISCDGAKDPSCDGSKEVT